MSSKRRLSNGSGVLGLDLVDDDEEVPIAPPRRRSIIPAQTSRDAQKDQGRIAEMYKTIIKMSSENKINAKNSWNLDLIDHMDKIISDEANEDGSDVNFQKASCTLDASIKIYSHRVDDTWSSSYRILENLSRNEHQEEADQDSSDDVKKPARVGAKTISNKHGLVDTIERNVANINSSQVEKENVADPMFHKMSQAFDEGGAKGMLMNNLRVVPNTSTITFSSMDFASSAAVNAEDDCIVLDELLMHLPAADLTATSICPQLQGYRDTLSHPVYEPSLLGFGIFDSALQPLAVPEQHDLVTKFEYLAIEDDFDADDGGDDDMHEAPLIEEVHDQKMIQWDTVFDTAAESAATPRSSLSSDTHMQPTVNMKLLSCLETTNLWAGAKHWKSSLRQRSAKEKAAEVQEAAPVKSRKKKEKFMFDFYNAVSNIETNEKSSKRDTTLQTDAAIAKCKQQASDLLLPIDEKLTKSDLCRLFLLDKFIQPKNCKMVFESVCVAPTTVSSPVPAMTVNNDNGFDDFDDGCDLDDYGTVPPIEEPLNTGLAINPADLLQASRTVEKIQIGYATTSKRVNVRKLKTEIWNTIECVKQPAVKTLEGAPQQSEVSFQDMISTVANQQTQKDVSVSFYFICLLHLANEKNLTIKDEESMADLTISNGCIV